MFGTVKVSGNDDTCDLRPYDPPPWSVAREIKVDTSGDRPTVVVDALIITKENAADNPGDW